MYMFTPQATFTVMSSHIRLDLATWKFHSATMLLKIPPDWK